MALIGVYKENPTAGGTDGTPVSTGGAQTNPVSFGPLDSSTGEVGTPMELAVRCVAGYATAGETTITPSGVSADKWALAPDADGSPGEWEEWGAGLTISTAISDTNHTFWIRARATEGDIPIRDTRVSLRVLAVVEEA